MGAETRDTDPAAIPLAVRPADFESYRRRRRREPQAETPNLPIVEGPTDDRDSFAFAEYTFDPQGVGTIRTESGESTNGDKPASVVLLIDPEGMAGIAMTADDALRLAEALIGAAISAREAIEV